MAFGKGKNNVQSVENVPKIKKEHVRNANKANRNTGVIVLLLVAIVVIAGVLIFQTMRSSSDVEIIVLNTSVPQDGLITANMLETRKMSAKDFVTFGTLDVQDATGKTKTTIVRSDESKQIDNKYANYFIKQGTPLYWDAIGTESPKQFSYLYNMDGELLRVNLSPTTFGKMLVPGDHINVRATYKENVYTLPTYDEFVLQQQLGINTTQATVERHIMLFNNVAILDMLNSSGESIFDLYYEVLALPKEQQMEVINSEDFIESVKPASMLLNVTPEEADRYMSIQSKGAQYMMTMLPRTTSNAITELLNELQTGFARKNSD